MYLDYQSLCMWLPYHLGCLCHLFPLLRERDKLGDSLLADGTSDNKWPTQRHKQARLEIKSERSLPKLFTCLDYNRYACNYRTLLDVSSICNLSMRWLACPRMNLGFFPSSRSWKIFEICDRQSNSTRSSQHNLSYHLSDYQPLLTVSIWCPQSWYRIHPKQGRNPW